MAKARRKPNILVTGTEATGKTTMCSLLADAMQLRHIDVENLVKEKGFHNGWSDELYFYLFNEDQICDELKHRIEQGGNIVDYHECFFFPKRWFDCVVVLQTNVLILCDRLTSRGYMGRRLEINIDLEVLEFLPSEAKSRYSKDNVTLMVLQSDCIEDLSRNFTKLSDWISNWKPPSTSS